jgi:DNA-binding LacI/PurR family transcriptional regulator
MRDNKPEDLTMADIARMAGVSESTVSRALAGSELVAEKTRKRITELASAAEYTVNEGARSLRLKKTKTIEVVIPIEHHHRQHISDPFFLDMLGALADAIADRDHDMLLSKIPPWATDKRSNALVSGRADGVIIIGQGRRRDQLRDFTNAHRRVVVWGAHIDDEDYTIVGSDNREGGRLAAAHLLSLGRKRIAFLGDVCLPEIKLRHAGYLDALQQAGVAADEGLTFNAPFDSEEAFAAAKILLDKKLDFDAIFAASDVIAMSAIAALGNAGMKVPQDVSVVGYDDIVGSAWYSPALTTVSQSIHEGGEALVRSLFARINGEAAASVILPPKLIIRQSCGA